MELTISEVKQAINSLPSSEREELREWLNEDESAKNEKQRQLQADLERYKKTDEWLRANREKYMNQWVCLDGDRLVAHSADGRDLYQKAKEAGIEIPFIHHIVEEKYPFGGW